MAKRKKHSGKKHHKKRRVSGLKKSPYYFYGAAVAGYFLEPQVDLQLQKSTQLAAMNQKVVAGAIGAAGVAAKVMGKGKPAFDIVGGLLVGIAAKKGLKEFGVVSGFRDVRTINGPRRRHIAGPGLGYSLPNSSLVNKNSAMSVVSGIMNGCASGSGAASPGM